jgi:hypothetical protein
MAATLLVGVGTVLWFLWKPFASREPRTTWATSLDVSSDRLSRTVVVPTLDTPIPEGTNAVWCSSFQLAWNHLKEHAKGPIQLPNAATAADRLNQAGETEADLDGRSVYAVAGAAKEGIIERIEPEMAKRFPTVPKPELTIPADGVVAYSYLAAGVEFEVPFFDNDKPFLFTDSGGKQTAVHAFGIREKDDYAYRKLRNQVKILYCDQEEVGGEKEIQEFVVDPCKNSSPYQVVVAQVKPAGTLAARLADVQQKIKDTPASDFVSGLHPRDTLLIPNMNWTITHRFKELEGRDKQFQNPSLRGLYLETALQVIQFKLDKGGADLSSETKIYVKPGASFFHVNRPFLVYLKKRGAGRPFFVAWVDNPELLSKP